MWKWVYFLKLHGGFTVRKYVFKFMFIYSLTILSFMPLIKPLHIFLDSFHLQFLRVSLKEEKRSQNGTPKRQQDRHPILRLKNQYKLIKFIVN